MAKLIFHYIPFLTIFSLTLASPVLLLSEFNYTAGIKLLNPPCLCQATYMGLFLGFLAPDAAGTSELPAILSGSCQMNYVLYVPSDFILPLSDCLGSLISCSSVKYSRLWITLITPTFARKWSTDSDVCRSRCNRVAITPATIADSLNLAWHRTVHSNTCRCTLYGSVPEVELFGDERSVQTLKLCHSTKWSLVLPFTVRQGVVGEWSYIYFATQS